MTSNIIWILCGGFFIFVFFFGGVLAIIFGFRNRKKGTESQNWPSVKGTIISTEIIKDTDTDEEGFTTTTYKPQIGYQYTLSENTYINNRMSFGGTRSYGSYTKAEQALSEYVLDNPVTVFYNPEDQSDSVLVQGTKGTMGLIILGIIFVGVAMITGCVGIGIFIANL